MIGNLGLWAVNYAIHSTILVAVAAVAVRFVRAAALRDIIWKVALVAAVVSASLQTLVPSVWQMEWRASAPAVEPGRETAITRPLPAPAAGTLPVKTVATTAAAVPRNIAVPRNMDEAPRPISIDPLQIVATLWGAGALFFLLRLAIGRRQMMRNFGVRRDIANADDIALLEELRRHSGCTRAVRLTESDDVPSPFATASFEICVPAALFASMTHEQKRAILAHEMAHLVRRDPQWLHLSELLNAILFFQPLNAFVQRQLRDASEFLCDDFVIVQTGQRMALAQSLAELATRVGPAGLPLAAMAEGRSRLVERVTRLLEPGRMPEREASWLTRGAVAAITLLIVTGAAPGFTTAATTLVRAPRVTTTPAARTMTIVAAAAAPAPQARTQVRSNSSHSVVAEHRAEDRTRDRVSGSFSDLSLSHDTDTSDMTAKARNVDVYRDGTVSFQSDDGYVSIHESRKDGTTRDVEIRAGRNGEERAFRINGQPVAWSEEARLLVAEAFRVTAPAPPLPPIAPVAPMRSVTPAAPSRPVTPLAPTTHGVPAVPAAPGHRTPGGVAPLAPAAPQAVSAPAAVAAPAPVARPSAIVAPRRRVGSSSSEVLDWRANIETTDEVDGVETRVNVRAKGVRYTLPDAVIHFAPGGSVTVEERIGNDVRRFTASSGQLLWSGAWNGASDAEREEWLVDLIGRHSNVPEEVIRNLAH